MSVPSSLTPMRGRELPRLPDHLLVAICGYRGGIGNPAPFSFAASMPWTGPFAALLDQISLLDLRRFVASNRDFFANVRSVGYQIDLLNECLRVHGGKPAEIRIEHRLADSVAREKLNQSGNVNVVEAACLFSNAQSFGGILLIYPDALGLGWSRAERTLSGNRAFVINGRRRLFALDAPTRAKLLWRRFLANTRFPEMIAGVVIVPVAALFAMVDGIRKEAPRAN